MRWIHLCGAACIASLLPSGVSADLIFDQSFNLGDGLDGAFASDFEFPQQFADDFKLLSGASTITDIHWWGGYSLFNTPTEPDNFTIRIFGDVGGTPAMNPVFESFVGDVHRFDTGLDPMDVNLFAYSVDISPLLLLANTTYWLSILNDTAKGDGNFWLWSWDFVGDTVFRNGDGFPWRVEGRSMGFLLTDDALVVPEPATWVLFAAGLAGLGWMSRRRTVG
jgi:hypothetical protein